MRKIILALFIALFCFSIGTAALQEEELSKEEKNKLEKELEIVEKQLEIARKIIYLHGEIEKLEKEFKGLEKKRDEEIDWDAIFGKAEEKPEQLSWEEKYRIYPSTSYWLDSLYKSYGLGKTDAEKLEEENDRLEDLLEDLRNERSALEWDMMRYRWDLEDAKPDPFDYQMALDSAIFSTIMQIDLGIYPYYPRYSRQVDRTNYEPLLFTLCTDSKGKMDWTKYGWLKLLLKKK